MKRAFAGMALVVLAAGIAGAATWIQEKPQVPKPDKEHAFLKKFVGRWDSTMSVRESGEHPWMDTKGTEQARMFGDFWVVSEWKSESPEMPMQGLGSTGFDPVAKKYMVTWIGSTSPSLSLGEGTVDPAGNVLTTTVRTQDCRTGMPLIMTMVQEFKDADTLVWTMRMRGKDGKDFECMKGESKRRK